jgi:predicted transcriptional regulator of viral defense system
MSGNATLDHLYDLAEGQDGYFSTNQAEAEGVSRHTLAKAARRGPLLRISRGVYRLSRYPEMSQNAHLWQAVLWPQVRTDVLATLSHYTALRLHGLSEVNPEHTHITVPRTLRIKRQRPPELVIYHANLERHEVQYVDGLPTTTVERTLRDVAAMGNAVALHDALRDARSRNLPIPRELADA